MPFDEDEARQITAILDAADQTAEANKRELETLRNEKQGLMHDLLTGCVRVKIGEPATT